MNFEWQPESFKIVIEENTNEHYIRIATNGKPDKELCERFKKEVLELYDKTNQTGTITQYAITDRDELLQAIVSKLRRI